jgi:hypothetical protein
MFHIIFTVESQALKVGHAKYCILLLQLYPLMLDEALYLASLFQIKPAKTIPLKIFNQKPNFWCILQSLLKN